MLCLAPRPVPDQQRQQRRAALALLTSHRDGGLLGEAAHSDQMLPRAVREILGIALGLAICVVCSSGLALGLFGGVGDLWAVELGGCGCALGACLGTFLLGPSLEFRRPANAVVVLVENLIRAVAARVSVSLLLLTDASSGQVLQWLPCVVALLVVAEPLDLIQHRSVVAKIVLDDLFYLVLVWLIFIFLILVLVRFNLFDGRLDRLGFCGNLINTLITVHAIV